MPELTLSQVRACLDAKLRVLNGQINAMPADEWASPDNLALLNREHEIVGALAVLRQLEEEHQPQAAAAAMH